MKNYSGNYTLVRQVKPQARWKVPGVKQYDPNWVVKFRVPGYGPKVETAKLYPICSSCMTVEGSPTEERPNCRVAGCQTDVEKWAKTRLEVLVRQARAEELAPKGAKKVKPLGLGEVLPVYLADGPDDKEENVRALRMILEGPTGRAAEQWDVEELTATVLRRFVRFYQEYARRWDGERGTGEERVARWATLRAEEAQIPPVDLKWISPANTTIYSLLQKARAVVGHKSRSVYVTCFDGRWPDLREWEDFTPGVARPDTRFNLSAEVYEKMCKGLPLLKDSAPQMWLALRIMWRTGLRPAELAEAKMDWLEMESENEGGEQVIYLVVKNRDDFSMKNWRTQQERVWPLDAETLDGIRRLGLPGGSILGLKSTGEAERLFKATSGWLRVCGVETRHTNYNLRKLVGTVVMKRDGAEATKRSLGHSDSRTSERAYAGSSAPLKALSDEDLMPGQVMGARRAVWVP